MADTAEVSISERLNERMRALDLSPADVASRCGVTEMTVRNWMQDAEKMYACNVRPLARALRCGAAYLLGLSDKLGLPGK